MSSGLTRRDKARSARARWWMPLPIVITAIAATSFPPQTVGAGDPEAFYEEFSGSLDPSWNFRDGYADQLPADTTNHASMALADDQLSLSFPGGAEHNQWWLRHAELRRPYGGSGVYEIKVDSDFTGHQQVGLSFESSPGTFMQFMLYSNGNVYAYVERFANVDGQQYKDTVAGVSTGHAVPHSGPWYLRVTVADNQDPELRTWLFEWSTDRVTWTTVASGVLEIGGPWWNAGQIQHVGVFAGNQPADLSAFDARIDYFYAGSTPLPPPVLPPSVSAAARVGSVDLWWNAVPAADSYRVYRAEGPELTPALIADTTALAFEDTAVVNDHHYVYAVSTVIDGSESIRSAPVTAIPHADPLNGLPRDGLELALIASELTYTLADGATVTSWSNSADTEIAATSSGSARPTLVTDGIGGVASVRFDGVDDYLSLGSGFEDLTAGVSMFVVARSSELQSGFKLVAIGNGAAQHNVVLGRAGDGDGLQYFTSNASGSIGWFNTGSALTINQPQLISVTQPGGAANAAVTATVSVNNSIVGSGGVYVPPVTTRSSNYLGRSYWNEGRFAGELAEVLIYNRALTPAETITITNYLTTKYFASTASPLAAPGGLAASAGDGTVALSWDAVAGATGYRVYRSANGAPATAIGDVSTTGHIDATVSNSTTYTYTVTTLNAAGESSASTPVTATPNTPAAGVIPTNGLVLGLDASTLTSTLADGAAVSTWAGTGATATGSGSARPTLVTDGIGGVASVRFDGVDDYLSLGSGFEDFTAGVSMFVVARSSELQSGFKLVAIGNGAAQHNVVLGRAGDGDGLQYFTSNASGSIGWFNTGSALTINQPQLISVTQPGGAANAAVTATVSVNNSIVGSGGVYVPPVTTRSSNYLGRSYWNEGRFAGELAEVLIYNRALTPAETITITNYLTTKYFASTASPLAAPGGLAASAGDGTVALSWDAVAGAAGYRVYRSANGAPATAIGDVSTTGHIDATVSNSTTYTYTVTTLNAAGESSASTPVTATPNTPAASPLAAPGGLAASAGDGTVALSWDAVAGATGYRVYRSANGAPATAIGDVSTTGHIDATVSNSTTYTYTVTTLNAAGESSASTPVTATPNTPAAGVIPTNGLVLGLDASTLTSTLADGAAVSTWAGTGATATGSGSARPTLVTDGIGGVASVRFDGVDDYLSLGSGFEDFTAGVSMFVVARSSELQSGFKLVAIGNGAAQHNVVLGRAGDGDGLQYFTSNASGSIGWFNTGSALTINQPQLISVTQPGGAANAAVTATVSVNNSIVGSGGVYVPPVTTRSSNYLGRSYWNEGRFAGELAEVLIYNRALTPAETITITNYLTTKYFASTASPLAAPGGLAASAGDGTVALSWDAVAGATGYRVYRSANGAPATAIGDVSTTGHIDATVSNSTTYTYTVTTLNAAGESSASTPVTATPNTPAAGVIPTNGLVLGLDASTLTSTLADGAAVSTWAGTGATATGSGSARPTLVTDGIGGVASVRFDGVDDYLSLGSGFEDFTAGVSMFVVARSSELQSGFKLVAIGNGAAQHNVVLGRAGDGDGLQYFTSNASGSIGWFNTGSALTINQPQLISVTQPGGAANAAVTATVSVNNSIVGSGGVYVPPVTTRSSNYLGRSYWNEGRFAGELAEVLIYNRALTPAETTTITNYLTTKYSLGQA